jgi:hypothetical protein
MILGQDHRGHRCYYMLGMNAMAAITIQGNAWQTLIPSIPYSALLHSFASKNLGVGHLRIEYSVYILPSSIDHGLSC